MNLQRSLVFVFLTCGLLASGALPAAEEPPNPIAWPAVTNETKPWSRWWWLGNISTEEGLRSEMEKYAEAGLGGLEITPIYGVRGYEAQHIPFLSPTFVDRLVFAGHEAKRLGMQIDMSTGTGWPFGGPWVDDESVARHLATKVFTVKGGERLAEPVRLMQAPILRFAGPKRVPLAEIKDPITANADLQDLAIDQVRFEKPLPLHTLMAYPENAAGGAPVDLTARVAADGTLDWTSPAAGGTWTLVAAFNGWHGKMVERAGPGGEGFAIDHFSSAALGRYLAKFDAAIGQRDLGAFRAWFNDSYEVDDAQGESDFTPRFFDEFQKRRGYDLRQHLRAFATGHPADEAARVTADYRETISDLMLDEFTAPWRAWANKHGLIIRNQAHGSPANLLDLYGASEIPEQEGSDLVAIKLASSAAHVMGRRLTSAEACTWLNDHFLTTLGQAKDAVDLFLLGGVNHICYHGTAYSPPEDPWPGFHFYASVEFNPSNPIWEHFGALNRYVTRVQSFLQAGQPDEDVLLYYNIHDRWAQRGNGAMPHFHGRRREDVGATAAGEALLATGTTFDFVSDRQLAGVTVADGGGVRTAAGTAYRAIVLPETKLIPVETLAKLVALAEAGATIIVHKSLPSDVPGFAALETRRAALRQLLGGINPAAADQSDVEEASLGRGRLLVGEKLLELLAAAGVPREPMVGRGLRFVRRRDGDDRVYFIRNDSTQLVRGWVPIAAAAPTIAIFNPLSRERGTGEVRPGNGGTGSEVFLRLEPGETCIVRTVTRFPAGGAPHFFFRREADVGVPLAGAWKLEFVQGGPELPASMQLKRLQSLTALGGDPLKAFSGTTRYSLVFARPPNSLPEGWWLDLGRVAESARVRLNGLDLGTVFTPPYRVRVPETLLRTKNELEIEVVNLGANRIADLDRRGVPWKKFYNINMPPNRPENRGPDGLFSAAGWEPRESGLLGPVTLVPLLLDTPEE